MTDQPRRVALVTGASRGIGAAVARRLGSCDFHVVLNHRSGGEIAQQVVAEIVAAGGSAETAVADVTDLSAVRKMVAGVLRVHGRIDVVVNNAGRAHSGLLLMTPDSIWWQLHRDNLAPVVNCTRAVLPGMVNRRSGVIINIASISGVRGTEGQTAYSSAKAAIIGFTRACAREVGPLGISVNCVAPGSIDTDMYRDVPEDKQAARIAANPLRRLGTPTEVAEVVAFLAQGRAPYLHGQVLVVDGGFA